MYVRLGCEQRSINALANRVTLRQLKTIDAISQIQLHQIIIHYGKDAAMETDKHIATNEWLVRLQSTLSVNAQILKSVVGEPYRHWIMCVSVCTSYMHVMHMRACTCIRMLAQQDMHECICVYVHYAYVYSVQRDRLFFAGSTYIENIYIYIYHIC